MAILSLTVLKYVILFISSALLLITLGSVVIRKENKANQQCNTLQYSTFSSPKLDTGSRIYLNQNSNQEFVLNCITDEAPFITEEEKSCVIDFTPQVTLEPTDSYGGFVLRNSNKLRINGNFIWENRLTKDSLFYVQDGSELFVSGSTFRE